MLAFNFQSRKEIQLSFQDLFLLQHSKDSEINELKSKFLKHRQVLVSNYEQAEEEVKRLDEIYHETVDEVLRVSPNSIEHHERAF